MRPIGTELPAKAPRSGGNAFSRWIGRSVLRLGGWQITGQWPNVDRLVVIVAPHSSAWDVVWGIAAKVAMGIGIVFMGKKEAFWGPLGWLLRKFGGIPVNRSAPAGIVQQIVRQMRESPCMWFVLAPEGTRKQVTKWKSGFWKIAKAADAPVFCFWMDYPTKTIGMGPMVELTEDLDADLVRIRQLFANHQGKNRGA